MTYGSSVLKTCAVLTFLATGTVSLGQPASNKPYKVCPDVPQAKDYPCIAHGPTASIVHRLETPKQDFPARPVIELTIKMLREESKSINALADELEQILEKYEQANKDKK